MIYKVIWRDNGKWSLFEETGKEADYEKPKRMLTAEEQIAGKLN
jgi:hypothetical protein